MNIFRDTGDRYLHDYKHAVNKLSDTGDQIKGIPENKLRDTGE